MCGACQWINDHRYPRFMHHAVSRTAASLDDDVGRSSETELVVRVLSCYHRTSRMRRCRLPCRATGRTRTFGIIVNVWMHRLLNLKSLPVPVCDSARRPGRLRPPAPRVCAGVFCRSITHQSSQNLQSPLAWAGRDSTSHITHVEASACRTL